MVDSEKASESSIDAAATTTTTASSAACDNLALSLHVLDNQPIPIACITPSPKLKYKDLGDNSSDLAVVKTMQLRRSPRFGSGDCSVSRKRKASVVVEMEVVREKSTRLLGNGFVMSNCNEVVDGKVLRSGKVVVLNKCGEGIGLIEWSGKDVCGKNVLRSGKCAEKGNDLVELPDKERRRTQVLRSGKCAEKGNDLVELPNKERRRTPVKAKLPDKEPKQTPVRAVSDVSSGKCLRSREIPNPVVAADDVDTNSSSPVKDHPSKDAKTFKFSCSKPRKRKVDVCFVGEPIPDVEARERWSWRYELKDQRRKGQSWILNADEEDEIILNVECHYSQAKASGCIFNIGDCAFIKGDKKEKHVGRILEFFRTTEGEDYFRVQWFYKAGDTVMKDTASFHDKKRLFYSTLMNDNLLECLISKVNVIEITRGLDFQLKAGKPTDFYYDMEYCVEYSTFRNLLTDNSLLRRALSSLNYTDTFRTTASAPSLEKDLSDFRSQKADFALLDLYAGCGGMSTGLCLGAELSGVNLVTRWAVDYQKSACESLKLNHPETQVKNMPAEDFLELLKEWKQLCSLYALNGFDDSDIVESKSSTDTVEDVKMPRGEYEVSYIVDITYDTIKSGKKGLKFKVRWKGYDSDDDTWEPLEGLSNCQEHLRDFVRSGLKSRILPLPGDVDVICGGPPCQGISGYNRFRNVDAPLNDERNHQIVVFMDIVKFLKPKYVLMENVTDILRFDKGSLGRYALSRMVHMKYQARLGIMAAGCYGLPQFRLRVFLWGALPSEKLPQFPLPTHDVVVKFWPPPEFEQNTVAYNEGQPRDLEDAVVLRDAISDLPAVTSHETREEMKYEMHPETEFQKYIRSTKYEIGASKDVLETESPVLYDHRPYHLNEDDYLRVCLIPRRKGANFRDLPGVTVDRDNRVCRDPTIELAKLPSGKPLVPDYVFTFEKGKSKKPFARVWWDETVGTVVTFPSCHSTAALHPEQDRVLTLREYARLQGFPDHYRFCGTMKERYCQVGNAVAVSVSRALGYALGMAFQKLGGDEPLVKLPPKFLSLVPGEAEKFASEH